MSFRPLPLLGNPHLQTVVGNLLGTPARGLPGEERRVPLPDGDVIALVVSTPAGWTPADPTALLVHGLTGSDRSGYMVRMAGKLLRRGVRAVRMNLRGCGAGHGLARRPYHAGCSDDVEVVLEALLAEPGRGPLHVIGFSLGGNITLKLAGELEARAPDRLASVLALAPGADLAACLERLSLPVNRLYQQWFIRSLREEARALHAAFPDLPAPDLPRSLRTIREVDDRYTAPRCGFASADDYYARCSAKPLVPRIACPTRVLLAEDDPVIAPTVLDGIDLPPAVSLLKVPGGGHLGFLGRPTRGHGVRWMDELILEWLGLG